MRRPLRGECKSIEKTPCRAHMDGWEARVQPRGTYAVFGRRMQYTFSCCSRSSPGEDREWPCPWYHGTWSIASANSGHSWQRSQTLGGTFALTLPVSADKRHQNSKVVCIRHKNKWEQREGFLVTPKLCMVLPKGVGIGKAPPKIWRFPKSWETETECFSLQNRFDWILTYVHCVTQGPPKKNLESMHGKANWAWGVEAEKACVSLGSRSARLVITLLDKGNEI